MAAARKKAKEFIVDDRINETGKASKCGRLHREEKCLAEHGETPNARFSRLYEERHGVTYYKAYKDRKKQ